MVIGVFVEELGEYTKEASLHYFRIRGLPSTANSAISAFCAKSLLDTGLSSSRSAFIYSHRLLPSALVLLYQTTIRLHRPLDVIRYIQYNSTHLVIASPLAFWSSSYVVFGSWLVGSSESLT